MVSLDTGVTTTLMLQGGGLNGYELDTDCDGTDELKVCDPIGVVTDSAGRLFVATKTKLYRLTLAHWSGASPQVTVVATISATPAPKDVAIDASDNIYIAYNFYINKHTPTAGGGYSSGVLLAGSTSTGNVYTDSTTGSSARFYGVTRMSMSQDKSVM